MQRGNLSEDEIAYVRRFITELTSRFPGRGDFRGLEEFIDKLRGDDSAIYFWEPEAEEGNLLVELENSGNGFFARVYSGEITDFTASELDAIGQPYGITSCLAGRWAENMDPEQRGTSLIFNSDRIVLFPDGGSPVTVDEFVIQYAFPTGRALRDLTAERNKRKGISIRMKEGELTTSSGYESD